jgi:hypothetical protein
MTRLTGTFKANGADGSIRTINILTDYVEAASRPGSLEARGHRRLATSDGLSINRLDKGRYQIVQTGEILTSDSPEAP